MNIPPVGEDCEYSNFPHVVRIVNISPGSEDSEYSPVGEDSEYSPGGEDSAYSPVGEDSEYSNFSH